MTPSLRARLLSDVARWRAQLDKEPLGPTHIVGIAGKAVTAFEEYFRQVLSAYCSRFSVDYDVEVRSKLEGKVLADLTLGQLIQCSQLLNRKLTRAMRSASPAFSESLASCRLLSANDEKILNEVNALRNKLMHRRQEFDKDLSANTSALVDLISTAMQLPLFQLAESNDNP